MTDAIQLVENEFAIDDWSKVDKWAYKYDDLDDKMVSSLE